MMNLMCVSRAGRNHSTLLSLVHSLIFRYVNYFINQGCTVSAVLRREAGTCLGQVASLMQDCQHLNSSWAEGNCERLQQKCFCASAGVRPAKGVI